VHRLELSKLWGKILDEDALFCPYCARRLSAAKNRSGFQISAGILTIVGACISASVGLTGILQFALPFRAFPFSASFFQLFYSLGMSLFCVFSFAFGLMSGIFMLRRTHFMLSILGVGSVLASGTVTIMSIGVVGLGAVAGSLALGEPVIVLSLLGLIFAAISRNEFI
jgi:hypothetical protein